MIRLFLLILTLFFLSNCSLKEGPGLWNKKEKIENQKKIKKLFSKEKKIITEFNPELKLDTSEIIFNNDIADNQNDTGAQNYKGLNEKINTFKFSTIKDTNQLNYKPIFLDEGLIFFDNKGTIIRYDGNGKVIWKKNIYSKSEKKLNPKLFFALDGENLLVTDNLAKYYSVNINYGELNWSKNNMYPFNSEIKITENMLFAVDYKNTLRAFNVSDGSELWNFQTENSFTISDTINSLIVVNNLVIFSSSIGDITAVDIENGLITWQLPTQSTNIINESYKFRNSKLVSDKKSIIFSNNKDEFYSIDIKTGVANWINEVSSSVTPILIGNLIFTVSNEGYLHVIEKNNGNIIRITDLYKNYKEKKRVDIKPIGFVIGNRNLYLTNSDGQMLVVDLVTGKSIYNIKVAKSFVSKPFISNENLFVIRKGSIIQYN
ncbi:PQQ-binding-like beta-propeller repeat protein [uncultured Candidatus Pelagibacter sp.]|uniref:outer membrane protein assembly factor BamB family protein n=1 Tax=uncultured Candidatus Pelagibacter sp. TaxID=372654 RepID=UPI00262520D4|nr:PQQ-binding-like beta-propeller repeat protein [uncultured Candidatus Pelagibacter sp.]